MTDNAHLDPERLRLQEDARRQKNWKRWGPYLSERQWATVREDYSPHGEVWDYFPHDHARSRAYRWGEDGLLGITDRECRLCLSLALWNGVDPILKERLFGLTGPEGNHGEDAKECWYYLDATPTFSYWKGLYKYPRAQFPYAALVEENRRRGQDRPEYEIEHTGVFDDGAYFDVFAEYAKASPDDILVRITACNRGTEKATLHLLPQLWFRNTWSWGRQGEGYWPKPRIAAEGNALVAEHGTLGRVRLLVDRSAKDRAPELLFCDNETNTGRLFGIQGGPRYPKDAFHRRVVDGVGAAVNPAREGTKAAAWFVEEIPAGGTVELRLRLCAEAEIPADPFGVAFERVFALRTDEAESFHRSLTPAELSPEEARVQRQARAGLLSTVQFYHLDVRTWLEGDPAQPAPPAGRGRNAEWTHLYNRDLLSMPDKWEYPWYAAWDLAFHMIPFAELDADFAKKQLLLLLREWYMAPNGQIPAYEFAFGDVNPPVHAWACWRVYKMTGPKGGRDRLFLARAFHKLLINFTWWVNRKDPHGRHLFAGGFLGLDNIGIFDRSRPLPGGGHLEQADGTAWMAFYCATMLAMAMELAGEDPAYEDVASKFFEHFVAITDAMNTLGGTGLWDEEDGFYYDQIHVDGRTERLKVRSMVGLVPLFAVLVLEQDLVRRLPGFARRMQWFLDHRPHLARHVDRRDHVEGDAHSHLLLSVASKERLQRMLRYALDEAELFSPHGVRSVSKAHANTPFALRVDGEEYRVGYEPGESTTRLFGGNSNWRGPVWFPLNYLLLESLEVYHHFYGDDLRVECPAGSGRTMNLKEVAHELARRLCALFLPGADGRRPCHGDDARYVADPHWRDLLLFHEYFHGDTGRGLGASHQTGWTALVTRCLKDLARMRAEGCADDGVCDERRAKPAAKKTARSRR